MSGVKFTIESSVNEVSSLAQSVTIRSDNPIGQQILFHFHRLMREAIKKGDYRSIFRSLGMMSDAEIDKAMKQALCYEIH